MSKLLRVVLLSVSALTSQPALAQGAAGGANVAAQPSLERQFQDPPAEARPRVWWHWMNGNITKDGIAKDLAWMKRAGLGGVQAFDAGLDTPQIVERRLSYMTPEWKDAFRFAASEADRLGLELTIAAAPGWSETGGPWVKPEDAMKKVVWSETIVPGGRPVGRITAPPRTVGPFQNRVQRANDEFSGTLGDRLSALYGEIAVLAVPVTTPPAPQPRFSLANGSALPSGPLIDLDLQSGVKVPRGTSQMPGAIYATYDTPQTIRSARLAMTGIEHGFTTAPIAAWIEAEGVGGSWTKVADLAPNDIGTTIAFAPVTARRFRAALQPVTPRPQFRMPPPPEGLVSGGFPAGDAAAPWEVTELALFAEPLVHEAETKAAFRLSPDYSRLGMPDAGARGVDPARVIDISARLRSDGTLDWTPPGSGQWRLIRLGWSLLGTTNHPASPEATGLEVDKYDAAAVRRYMDHYLGTFRDAVGPELFGARGVRAVVTDSIEAGAANWTPRLIEQFRRRRGYDPMTWLPVLAGVLVGTRDQSDRFLFDYRLTLTELIASEHYGTVAEVAHENGLKVYGEALEMGRPSIGDDMAMRSHADFPMAAMWTFQEDDQVNPSLRADIRGAASVAHIYGQNLVAAESMTSAGQFWADTPRTLKPVIDLEFALGVNRPVIHTSVHQPADDKKPGLSLQIFGQYFTRHEAWADLARPWIDYIARSSLLLQQGRNVADVAYFYGEEAPLTGLYGQQPVPDAPHRHAYDFVNRDALLNMLSVEGQRIVSKGGASYTALYLGGSSQAMSLAVLRRIKALADAGATVIGQAPKSSPTLQDDAVEYAALVRELWPGGARTPVGLGQVIASSDIDASLAAIGVHPQFMAEGARDLLFVHRQLPDGALFFLNNRLPAPQKIIARFRVTGKQPQRWHAESGAIEPLSYRIENGETVVPLDLAARDAVFVVFKERADVDNRVVPATEIKLADTLEGAWDVAFQPDRGAPATIRLPRLVSLSTHADAGVRYFSGVATYSKVFDLPHGVRTGAPLWLDLGLVGDLAQVSVNGKDVGTVWHVPYRIDVGSAIQEGRNRLEIRTAGTWINRMIGDAQPGAAKITWTVMPTYRADAPLRSSGLIGPVRLLVAVPKAGS